MAVQSLLTLDKLVDVHVHELADESQHTSVFVTAIMKKNHIIY